MKKQKGITLLELLFVMAIFSFAMAALYSSYTVLIKQGQTVFQQTETAMETTIGNSIIERDLLFAGYGLPDDYSFVPSIAVADYPRAANAVQGVGAVPDELILMGTAIATGPRAAQGWTYAASSAPLNWQQWNDAREDVNINDIGILIEPTVRSLLPPASGSTDFIFKYGGPAANLESIPNSMPPTVQTDATFYGMYRDPVPQATLPCSTVRYYLGDVAAGPANNCAPGTRSLLRAEAHNAGTNPGSGQPIMSCVLDFQVAFGLAVNNEDGIIDSWDDGGAYARANYVGVTGPTILHRRLKQIRAYVLVQDGERDPNYTYTDPVTGNATIRVGDANLLVGHDVVLTAEQQHYRWRMMSFIVTPRNIR